MSKHTANLPNLVIANGATTTTTPITAYLDDAETVTITAPSALTGTVTINVSPDGGTTYGNLQSGGSNVTIAASASLVITDVSFTGLKVTSGSAEGAARTFVVSKTFKVGR